MENQLSLNIPDTGRPRVVIIGGGFGGLNAAKQLRNKNFQVVLFDKHNYHTFQPLLYQVATAGLPAESIAAPLRSQFRRFTDFHFRLQRVTNIDPDQQMITTPAGSLHFDYCIIAGGAKPNFFGNKDIERHAMPMKSIPDALNLRSQMLQMLEQAGATKDAAERRALLTIILVGGGPTGVETAGALAELKKHVFPKDYPDLDLKEINIILIEGLPRLLPAMSEKAGRLAHKALERMGVHILLNSIVDSYDGRLLHLKDGSRFDARTVLWTAGVTGETFPGLKPTWAEKGRLLVDPHCRLLSAHNIFAIGDLALMKSAEYPKGHPGVAQTAIQMGKYVGRHLPAIHAGRPVPAFKYFDKGSLAAIGRGKAVADLPGNLRFGGRLAWWIWLFVHIDYLISFRNKLLVFSSWIWNYFTYDKGNKLIIRPFLQTGDPLTRETTEATVPEEAQIYH
jgi:NADH dehydrogenase